MPPRPLNVVKTIKSSWAWKEWAEQRKGGSPTSVTFWETYENCLIQFGETLDEHVYHARLTPTEVLDLLTEFDAFFHEVGEGLSDSKPPPRLGKGEMYHYRSNVKSEEYDGHAAFPTLYKCCLWERYAFATRFGFSEFELIDAIARYDLRQLPYSGRSLVLNLLASIQASLTYVQENGQESEERKGPAYVAAYVALVRVAGENNFELCLDWNGLRILSKMLSDKDQLQISHLLTCGELLLICPKSLEDRDLNNISKVFKDKAGELLAQVRNGAPAGNLLQYSTLSIPCFPKDIIRSETKRAAGFRLDVYEPSQVSPYLWYFPELNKTVWFLFLNGWPLVYHMLAEEVWKQCDKNITVGDFVRVLEGLLE